MTGQIPKYGEHFTLTRGSYDPFYNRSIYVSKRHPRWSIRSDKTSKKWFVFYKDEPINSQVYPSLTKAMEAVKVATRALYGANSV